MELILGGLQLILLPEKAVWIPALKSLIVADVHLDKAAHFRKNGLPVPDLESTGSIKTLAQLLQALRPEQLVVLGDLIHTTIGQELSAFTNLTSQIPACKLITGNHDKQLHGHFLGENWEASTNMRMGEVLLVHGDQPIPSTTWSICGHWHPGVRIKMEFKKQVFPAFIYRNQQQLILPAFGKFTGLQTKMVLPADEVFIVNSGKIWQVAPSRLTK